MWFIYLYICLIQIVLKLHHSRLSLARSQPLHRSNTRLPGSGEGSFAETGQRFCQGGRHNWGKRHTTGVGFTERLASDQNELSDLSVSHDFPSSLAVPLSLSLHVYHTSHEGTYTQTPDSCNKPPQSCFFHINFMLSSCRCYSNSARKIWSTRESRMKSLQDQQNHSNSLKHSTY